MNTQAYKLLPPALSIKGMSVILVCALAIGSLAISAQGFSRNRASLEPPVAAEAPATEAGPRKCAECGVIVSARKIEPADERIRVKAPGRIAAGSRALSERKPVRNYEITIRLQDGSTHVITDANAANWRHGERVIIIAGAE
jgi:hypothetical protein